MNNETEKSCPFCLMKVDDKAVKCGHCQEWLNKFSLSWRNPYLIVSILALSSVGVTLFQKHLIKKSFPKFESKEYSAKKDHISISDEKLVKEKNAFYIVGKITNKDSFVWKHVGIHGSFFNKDETDITAGYGSVGRLEPNETKLFKISFGCPDQVYDPSKHHHFTTEISSAFRE